MSAITDLEDLYPRLVANLPALSTGQSSDNAAGYAATVDPRRAPVRVEISDLIAEIEAEVPTLTRYVCSVTGLVECVVAPCGSDRGRDWVSPQVMAGLHTLHHHWFTLEDYFPQVAEVVTERLARLVTAARRLVGEAPRPPVPLLTRCPECGVAALFRVETPGGMVAACSGCRGQWSEAEWADAHAPKVSVSTD